MLHSNSKFSKIVNAIPTSDSETAIAALTGPIAAFAEDR